MSGADSALRFDAGGLGASPASPRAFFETPDATAARPRKLTYRADLDGLRAVAIVPVVLFHLGSTLFSGGFVGVDVFFVISGFLITSIVVDDLAAGRFSFAKFYERRVRRIFPALIGMTLACLAAAFYLLTPLELNHLGESVIAMALFVSNIAARYSGAAAGYFDRASHINVLLHTWSLSVEEQFYIFLPPAVLILWRGKRNVTLYLSVAAFVSFALCIAWTFHNPKEAFYFPFTRAWELLAGSILAVAARPPLATAWRETAGVVGLACIVVATLTFSAATLFPGDAALLPCLGACLVIGVGFDARPTLAGRLLSSKPFVALGKLSYSLYLWHWPVIVFYERMSLGNVRSTNVTTRAALFGVSLALATLSYFGLERPFRTKRLLPNRTRILAFGGAVTIALVAFGICLRTSEVFSAFNSKVVAANVARMQDRPADEACMNWQNDVRKVADIQTCQHGLDAAKKIVFWGDSHVDTMRPLITRLFGEGLFGNRAILFTTASGCTSSANIRPSDEVYRHCNAFQRLARERMSAADVDTVFIGFMGLTVDAKDNGLLCASDHDRCLRPLTAADAMTATVDDIAGQIGALRARNVKVILMLPWPSYSADVPQYEIDQFKRASSSSLLPTQILQRVDFDEMRKKLLEAADRYGAVVFDPRKSLCTGDACTYARNHVSIYSDFDHIAVSQMGILEQGLSEAFRQVKDR